MIRKFFLIVMICPKKMYKNREKYFLKLLFFLIIKGKINNRHSMCIRLYDYKI